MGRLMAIYAHPDDEAFSMAGSLARATAAGHVAAVVCATRGEKGAIADPALATPATLGRVREEELRRACAAVGVQDVSFLGYSDGGVAAANHEQAVGRITAHLRRFRPDVVVTFAANGGYGHRDHIAIHRLTLDAVEAAAQGPRAGAGALRGPAPHRVRKLYFSAFPREAMTRWRAQAPQSAGQDVRPGGDTATIPLEEMGTPEAEMTTIVVLTDEEFARKQQAMRAHATQMPADTPLAQAPAEVLRQIMGREHFVLAPPPLSDRPYPTPEDDLLAGL